MKTLLLFLALFSATACADEPAPEVELLDFTASYCKPCQQMLPILKRMQSDGFPVRQVDITENPELARQYRVEAVPSMILLVRGRETKRFVGLTEESLLRRSLNDAARQVDKENRAAEAQRAAIAEPAAPVPEVSEKSSGKSLGDLFRLMFPRWGQAAQEPIIRGQSPELPGDRRGQELAAVATVRVTVEGTTADEGLKVRETGTGTIIHSAAGESVILTCSHFFQGLDVKSTRTTVEAFTGGEAQQFPAQVIMGNHRLDLAILKIQPGRILPAISLAEEVPELTAGEELVSFGCDAGAEPSKLSVTLVDQDRYDGPGNLICSKAPASGRSGGGLYTAAGQLVGICSCANRNLAEGLYMSRGAVAELLSNERLSWLRELIKTTGQAKQTPTADEGLAETGKADADTAFSDLLEEPFREQPEVAVDTPAGSESEAEGFPEIAAPGAAETAPGLAAGGPEVTVIIDDRQPGAQKKVIVIPRASPWLMEMLTGEKAEANAPAAPAVRRSAAKKPTADVSAAAEARYPQ